MGIFKKLFNNGDSNPKRTRDDNRHQEKSVKERNEIAQRLSLLQIQLDVMKRSME